MAKKKASPKRRPATKPQANIEKLVAEEVAKQVPKVDKGIAVAIPNTAREKMKAICDLASAVSSLATSLASVNTNVVVSHCNIHGARTGVHIDTEEVPEDSLGEAVNSLLTKFKNNRVAR